MYMNKMPRQPAKAPPCNPPYNADQRCFATTRGCQNPNPYIEFLILQKENPELFGEDTFAGRKGKYPAWKQFHLQTRLAGNVARHREYLCEGYVHPRQGYRAKNLRNTPGHVARPALNVPQFVNPPPAAWPPQIMMASPPSPSPASPPASPPAPSPPKRRTATPRPSTPKRRTATPRRSTPKRRTATPRPSTPKRRTATPRPSTSKRPTATPRPSTSKRRTPKQSIQMPRPRPPAPGTHADAPPQSGRSIPLQDVQPGNFTVQVYNSNILHHLENRHAIVQAMRETLEPVLGMENNSAACDQAYVNKFQLPCKSILDGIAVRGGKTVTLARLVASGVEGEGWLVLARNVHRAPGPPGRLDSESAKHYAFGKYMPLPLADREKRSNLALINTAYNEVQIRRRLHAAALRGVPHMPMFYGAVIVPRDQGPAFTNERLAKFNDASDRLLLFVERAEATLKDFLLAQIRSLDARQIQALFMQGLVAIHIFQRIMHQGDMMNIHGDAHILNFLVVTTPQSTPILYKLSQGDILIPNFGTHVIINDFGHLCVPHSTRGPGPWMKDYYVYWKSWNDLALSLGNRNMTAEVDKLRAALSPLRTAIESRIVVRDDTNRYIQYHEIQSVGFSTTTELLAQVAGICGFNRAPQAENAAAPVLVGQTVIDRWTRVV